jgi:hypothetical protein
MGVTVAYSPTIIPAWASDRKNAVTEADAAFLAGSALNSLDGFIKKDHAWTGCWRSRLALRCAISANQMLGRETEEAALRDAVLMVRPGDNAGPAGNVLLATRMLKTRMDFISSKTLRSLTELFALRWDSALADLPVVIDEIMQKPQAAPIAVAELVTRIHAVRPDVEVLAWWLGDWVLAKRLGWDLPVPFFLAQRYSGAFRTSAGKGRVAPGEQGFNRAVSMALVHGTEDVLLMANEIGRRADRTIASSATIRTKGGDRIIRQLLSEDAVSASAPGTDLSRWASSRFFERLETMGGVRELSGRSTFRVYGI